MAILLEKEAMLLKDTYDANMRHLAINITDRCNMHCTCCYKDSGNTSLDITKELIDKALSFIDSSWCVDITGGEPTLRMDLVEYTVKQAKKLGCITRLASNGLFLKDIKKILKLKIDYISIGVNQYHTHSEEVQKVIKAVEKSRKTKLFLNGIVDDPIMYEYNSKMFIIKDYLTAIGREKVGNPYRFDKTTCTCQGITVFPNGVISPFCFNGKCTCVYWNINDFSKEIIQKYFNSENRRAYSHEVADMKDNYCEFNLIPESEENDVKEKTKRGKGLPIM